MTDWNQFDWAGVVFGLAMSAVGFGVAYWMWPEGASDKAISALTVVEGIRIVGAGFLGLSLGVGGIYGAIKDASDSL